MSITTKVIMKMYEDGASHVDIAQKIIESGELDDMTDALKVVEEIILTCKLKRGVRV